MHMMYVVASLCVLCIQEPQLYTKEWCKNGVVGIKMGGEQIFSFGFGCGKTKDELMKLGDVVLECLVLDGSKMNVEITEEWAKEECGEWPPW